MLSKQAIGRAFGGLLALALLLPASSVLADEHVGTIRGRAFLDANENGGFDEGETALAGVDLELANGEQILKVSTAEDGAFSVAVGPGVWRVNVWAPDGYLVLNDATREVTIAADETTEAVMDFALRAPAAGVADPLPAVAVEAAADAALLPESGASLPSGALFGFLALLVLLLVGVVLIAYGRWVTNH